MADINLLSGSAPKDDGKKGDGKGPKDEELKLHVPEAEPEEPSKDVTGDLLAALKPKPAIQAPASILSQKIDPIPVAPLPPKPPAPPLPLKMVVPVPPKPPAPPAPPKPPKPPAPPLPPEREDGGTLRVSLITTGAGAGLSEIALRRRLRSFALFGLLGLVVDGMVFGGLLYQRSLVEKRNADAEQQVVGIDQRIAAREKDLSPVRDFQQLVRMEQTVLANHAHWSGVLKLLEDDALQQAQFGSLSGADTGTLSFEVQARDYTTLAKQILAFRQDPRVRKVTAGTASADYGDDGLLKGAHTSMILEISSDVFKFDPNRTAASASVSTPASATQPAPSPAPQPAPSPTEQPVPAPLPTL